MQDRPPTTDSRASRTRRAHRDVTPPPPLCPSPGVGAGARDLIDAQAVLMEVARTLHGVRSLLDSLPASAATEDVAGLRIQVGELRNRFHMAARDIGREIDADGGAS